MESARTQRPARRAAGLHSEQWNVELTASTGTPSEADGEMARAAAFRSVRPPRERHVILVTVRFLGGRRSRVRADRRGSPGEAVKEGVEWGV